MSKNFNFETLIFHTFLQRYRYNIYSVLSTKNIIFNLLALYKIKLSKNWSDVILNIYVENIQNIESF